MALYLTTTLTVVVKESENSTREYQSTSDTVTDSTTLTETSGLNRKVVADGATDEALAFSGVSSAKHFYFKADQDVSIKLNGSSTALSIAKNKAFSLPATITACTVTNASGNDANIDYSVID